MKYIANDKKMAFNTELIVSLEGNKLERELLCTGKFITKNKM